MVLVRIVFHAKLGRAQEIVQAFKSWGQAESVPAGHVRILTDLSGQFDTVVQEVEVESLDVFFREAEKMFADPKWQEGMSQMGDAVMGGYKEFYTIEYSR